MQDFIGGQLSGIPKGLPPESIIFGKTSTMQQLQQRVEKVAAANVPVLIQGESGTGKEVLAKYIHARSPWNSGPFVKVNCPAIPGTLLESELFGYERGAFTGAYGSKPGRVEMANRGTLFLDEISELDPSLQAKLLQLLQDGQFCRIGGQEETRVEVRLLCATNHQLEQQIETGAFRQDLFYRINVVNIHLPPLRERRADIPDLVEYFLAVYNERFGCSAGPVSDHLMSLMQNYGWPGNIRQLENLIKRYVILGSEEAVSNELLEVEPTYTLPEIDVEGSIPFKKLTRQAIRELERKIIIKALQANRWNRKQTAKALNISYRALLYKIRQVSLSPPDSRRQSGKGPVVSYPN